MRQPTHYLAALAAFAIALTASCAAPDPDAVPFETFREDTYASFVMNTYPDFFLAAIRSPDEWNAILNPAPIDGNNQAFGPDSSLYSNKMILLIRHVAPERANWTTFGVDSVRLKGNSLTIIYRYNQPSSRSGAFWSGYIGIIIPRAAYTDATFIENGKNVGTIPINVR